ncbi:hypothetical protein [Massilia horti]|uniref:Outer membrane protein assembly factor BamE n=1 Tax=Massilia horti TaxID=2562153 RepID=A0A4Y9SZ25_9BURK|nr:hypothetical protein [Massilia horti]TFW31711.1 hypothetical protein E4O92_12915 [Massilia horti]
MSKITTVAGMGLAMAIAGCALFRTPPDIGDTQAQVIEKMGQPNAIYPEPDGGRKLEYTQQPMGEYAFMATIGPDGRLTKYEQVLTGEKFATIKIGQATKADVLRTIGHPGEITRVMQHDYEVWSYHYRESGVWYSVMNVEFDQNGIVQQMLNQPDPRYNNDGGRRR